MSKSKKLKDDSTSQSPLKLYIRPEPSTAQYYNGKQNFLDDVIKELSSIFSICILPRSAEQAHHYLGNSFQHIAVAEKPISFEDIANDCDVFVGAEGGLANLAFAVGTDTILTSDFIHQLYGPKGVIQQVPKPMCEPIHYGGPNTHINLDPYLTDEEVFLQIVQHLDNKRMEIGK